MLSPDDYEIKKNVSCLVWSYGFFVWCHSSFSSSFYTVQKSNIFMVVVIILDGSLDDVGTYEGNKVFYEKKTSKCSC